MTLHYLLFYDDPGTFPGSTMAPFLLSKFVFNSTVLDLFFHWMARGVLRIASCMFYPLTISLLIMYIPFQGLLLREKRSSIILVWMATLRFTAFLHSRRVYGNANTSHAHCSIGHGLHFAALNTMCKRTSCLPAVEPSRNQG
jgi:hypothetical protein